MDGCTKDTPLCVYDESKSNRGKRSGGRGARAGDSEQGNTRHRKAPAAIKDGEKIRAYHFKITEPPNKTNQQTNQQTKPYNGNMLCR